MWPRNKWAETSLEETRQWYLFRERCGHVPCYLVILERQPSLNHEGIEGSGSSLTRCLYKESGCIRPSAQDKAGGNLPLHADTSAFESTQVLSLLPASLHLHSKSTPQAQADLSSTENSSKRTYSLSRFEKRTGDRMMFYYATERKLEDEDSHRKRVNTCTSFPGLLLWCGENLKVSSWEEKLRVAGKLQSTGPCLWSRRFVQKLFICLLPLPKF